MSLRKQVWSGKVCRILAVTGMAVSIVTSSGQVEAAGTKPVDPSSSGIIKTGGLEKLLDQFMNEKVGEDKEAPGGAVVVVQDGRIVLSKGYGYADLNKKTAVNPERTLFRIGSVTKTFTAAAIMQLVEQGKLDLHEDIHKYLGGMKLNNPFLQPVTIHHLLTHTSGFQVTVEKKEDIYEDLSMNIPLKEFIEGKKPPVVREPGTAYMYDNYAYNLLGLIIANVTGMSYQQYMEEHVLKPLKMNNAQITITKEVLPYLATGYEADNSPIAPYMLTPAESPDGGMLTTAENVGHFMIAQLNGGAYEGNRLWSEDSLALMHQYHSSISKEYPDTTYGYENLLQPGKNNGQLVISKGGDVPGYSSFVYMLPNQKFGVFVTFNKLISSAYALRDWNELFMVIISPPSL